MSNLSEKTLYEIFSIGIEEEQKAQELYLQGATLAGEDSELGKMFLALASDESAHEQALMDNYAAFKARLTQS